MSKSIPSSSIVDPARTFFMSCFCHWGKVDLKSGNLDTPGQTFSFGVPRVLNILNSWSISLSPGKRARLVAISAKIQPIDQRSTAGPYSRLPIKISGARYQRVTTSCVYVLIGRLILLANPKSASLMFPRLSINKFWGLRSRWRTRWAWQWPIPWSNCHK